MVAGGLQLVLRSFIWRLTAGAAALILAVVIFAR
jgi:hypothetical protein